MYKETLQTISHVEIYAMVGFIIFFTFFIFVAVHAFRMGKDEVTRLSNMPLDDQDIEQAKE